MRTSAMLATALVLVPGAAAPRADAQAPRAPVHAERARTLAIRNATIVDGNGTPARGPADILIEGNRIARIVYLDPVALRSGTSKRPVAETEIDATGKYVLPGLINAHAHLQNERAKKPQPLDYNLKLWLASGITTVREVGSDSMDLLFRTRDASARGAIAAPRILIYARFSDPVREPATVADARARVQQLKQMGADGIKLTGIDRDLMAAMLDEAHKAGLRVAHHTGVEETNALDDARYGTTSIEHWYGVPDAAIADGRQRFPSSYNYRDESDRFRGPAGSGAKRIPCCSAACSTPWWRRRWRGCPRSTSTRRRGICSARRRSHGSVTTCTRRSRSTSVPIPRITARTSWAGAPATRPTGRRTIRSGWPRCAISNGAEA
ncbi:MAG TPA: amidohydrolase family protein [Gemmatimonadaceae bacterium]|nr:amidohydrolase family protein [Gemmatimonadaceae bacterium]